MLNSKQRAFLRGQANGLEPILQVGKGGVNPPLIHQADDALEARELIKIRVLENSPLSIREAAEEISGGTGAEVIQVIGAKAVLFRKKRKDSQFSV